MNPTEEKGKSKLRATAINRLSVSMSASWAGSSNELEDEKPPQRSKYLIHDPPKYDALDMLTPESNAF
jgi:hypothetical protein